MIDVGTWEDFLLFVSRSSWAWKSLIGQEDERKLLGFLGTKVASTSGTSIDFTSIPTWVTRIEINFFGVSTSGTSGVMVQTGDSGGIETSGYLGTASNTAGGGSTTATLFTTGFGICGTTQATSVIHGTLTLTLEDPAAFTWIASGSVGFSDSASTSHSGGSKSTSAALDRVRITTVGGSDTFDAGAINIRMS